MSNGDTTIALEHNTGPLPLKLFIEKEVLPYIPEWGRGLEELLQGLDYPKVVLDEFFQEFMTYDPHAHNGEYDSNSNKHNCFLESVIRPTYVIATSQDGVLFDDMKQPFLERTQEFANALYRNAFFRNTYDNYEAWRICCMFKDYQQLFEHLGLLSEDARTRIAGMSEELDRLWSQPDTEQVFSVHIAEEATGVGVLRGSMLDRIYQDKPRIIPLKEYGSYHELRPDLFPETYEDYLKQFEESKHPYVLRL